MVLIGLDPPVIKIVPTGIVNAKPSTVMLAATTPAFDGAKLKACANVSDPAKFNVQFLIIKSCGPINLNALPWALILNTQLVAEIRLPPEVKNLIILAAVGPVATVKPGTEKVEFERNILVRLLIPVPVTAYITGAFCATME